MLSIVKKPRTRLRSGDVLGWLCDLGHLESVVDDGELVDQLDALERVNRAIAAAQATISVALYDSQCASQPGAGAAENKVGASVRAQIALARREPPHRGKQLFGVAKVLVEEMPNTFAALQAGLISEYAATLVVKETSFLTAEDRHLVDLELAARFPVEADYQLGKSARKLADQADPAASVRRTSKAVSDRRVSCRPAPDTMTFLTGHLPVADGVAVVTSLSTSADSARAGGDTRSRGQIMADTLVEAITGHRASQHQATHVESEPSSEADDGSAPAEPAPSQAGGGAAAAAGVVDAVRSSSDPNAPATPDTRSPDTRSPDPGSDNAGEGRRRRPKYKPGDILPGYGPGSRPDVDPSDEALPAGLEGGSRESRGGPQSRPPIELKLIMTDTALFGGGNAPAILDGEPIPAWLARDLVADPDTKVRVRRLYTHPTTDQLIAMESTSRVFAGGLRDLVRTRDQRCRNPWCNAPIRHTDHVQPVAQDGRTSYDNGQGLCEGCNYLKELQGWTAYTEPDPWAPDGPPVVVLTTPAGRTYRTRAPGLASLLRAQTSQQYADFDTG